MKIVALLPIKAHSARISGKNFRMFAGKPLFQWILDTLLSIEEIDQVIINTDARAILRESGLIESAKIVVRDRKPELCGDFVSMNLVLADDVKTIQSDMYLMTHTTNPLLKADSIKDAIRRFKEATQAKIADSLFSVSRHQTRFYRADSSPVNHDPNKLIRTQDLEPWFEENSHLYLFTRESFRSTGARIGGKPIMHETRRIESIDIDDAEGWELAETIALAQPR